MTTMRIAKLLAVNDEPRSHRAPKSLQAASLKRPNLNLAAFTVIMVAVSFGSCAFSAPRTLSIGINLSPQGNLTVNFRTGTNVRATVQITNVRVPSLAPIGRPSVHLLQYAKVNSETTPPFEQTLEPSSVPLHPDRNLADNWARFVTNPASVKVDVSYTYDNRGQTIRGEPLCKVYLAHWSVKTKRGRAGGGGFIDCEDVVSTWEYVNKLKQEEAQGILRD